LIGYSFNASALVSVWGGFSTGWYGEVDAQRSNPRCRPGLSLKIGVVVSTGAVILGTLAAIALVRFKFFRGRLLLTGMVQCTAGHAGKSSPASPNCCCSSRCASFWAGPHRGFTTIVDRAPSRSASAYVTITVPIRASRGADHSLEEARPWIWIRSGARLHRHHAAQHRARSGIELAAELPRCRSTIW